MALFILNPGITPLGDFDVLDTDQSSILGGELMTLTEASRTITSTEKAAADVLDGYLADAVSEGTPDATRVVARIADETSETYNLFYLADDGVAFYGTLFGSTIGDPVGLNTTGTALGPNTMSGSGKVTLWDKPGLYAVSLTAANTDLVPRTTGTNTWDTPLPGTLLYRGTNGRIARASGTSDVIGAFIELGDNGALVTTPNRLVGAAASFDRVTFQFFGATARS